MGILEGFDEIRKKVNSTTFFDYAGQSGQSWTMELNDGSQVAGVFKQIEPWTVTLEGEDGNEFELPKHDIELMYLTKLKDAVAPHISLDKDIQKQKLVPEVDPAKRFHIKNKSLYVLFDDKESITVTTLGGRKVSGAIGSFARYEIVLAVAPKTPIVLLRHAVFQASDSKEQCILQSTQHEKRDWTKSKLWKE